MLALWQRQSRLIVLSVLLIVATGYTIFLGAVAPPPDQNQGGFTTFWLLAFLPYLAACMVVLLMRVPEGRGRWLELGIIIGGALLMRALLLPVLPDLSHDSWRYLWDARVTLNGYSPYVVAPGGLPRLFDILYTNSRFRNVPTIYPPGAQAFYLVSYLLAPENLVFLKGIFTLCELVTCSLIAYLLYKKGHDPARCIIYAWCPLPIVEFAIQGHLDVLPILFTLLTLVCARGEWRGARVCTGFCLAMATLTKLYPLLIVVAIIRRKDWALLVTCAVTIVIAYIPYLILGHGQVFGFFSTYADEFTPNAGLTPHIMHWFGDLFGLDGKLVQVLNYVLDLLVLGGGALAILLLRKRDRLSMEMATLIVFGLIFSVSSHIFPWYTTALLPFVALLLEPLSFRRLSRREVQPALLAKWIALLTTWYFTVISITAYYYTRDWSLYYIFAYDLTLVGLGLAVVVALAGKKMMPVMGFEKKSNGQREREIHASNAVCEDANQASASR